MKIEVITDKAFDRLAVLAVDACCIRAVMAYWTIPALDLPLHFLQALKHSDSYLCVDIHNPTSINALESLNSEGVNVGLHLFSTTGKSEVDDSLGMPNHLMHSKVIIFDYDNADSIVWVGSHNGTFRALKGINLECALAIATSTSSKFYGEVVAHLNAIHESCQTFQHDLIEHYRFLQGNKLHNAISIMEFENGNNQPLSIGEEISIFNMSKEDSHSLKTINSDVYVSVHGSVEKLYHAKLVQIGETPTTSSQTFGVRRYSDREKQGLPVLLGSTAVTPNMFKKGTYYAIVKIEDCLDSDQHSIELPTQSAWVNLPNQAKTYFSGLDANQLINKNARGSKGLKFKVPVFKEMTDFPESSDQQLTGFHEDRTVAFHEINLSQKMTLTRPTLIRKKLLVRR